MNADALTRLADASAAAIPDPATLLLLALITDWLIGDPAWLYRIVPHPVVLIGRLIGFLDKKLNRASRPALDRHVRGGVTVILVVGTAATTGWVLSDLARSLPHGWLIEAVLAGILIAARDLWREVGKVAKALKDDGLDAGRAAVGRIVGRDPKSLDKHGVARAAVESLSENFADGVVAPAFWFLLLGLPGIFAYKAINTLDSMIGYKSEKYREFGYVAAKLDDVANWIPARLSALLTLVAAIPMPGADPHAAWAVIRRDAGTHKSPNAGWPEAAFAGALGLALGGPRHYPGVGQVGVWIGDGKARLLPRDISRARRLFIGANLVMLIVLLVAAILI